MTRPKHSPTEEQARIVDAACAGGDLRVKALAGTGKTDTIARITEAFGSRRVCYSSFNRKEIDDARGRLSANVDIRTNHSLAFRSVGARYQNAGKLADRFSVKLVLDRLGWTRDTFGGYLDPLAGTAMVIQAVNRYCGSGDESLGMKHVALPRGVAAMKPPWEGEAKRAIAHAARGLYSRMRDLSDKDIPATHDTYLKEFCLARPRLNYPTIIIDEAQDTSGAVIGLLQAQEHAQRIIVGDHHQAIYGFRGAVNALERMRANTDCSLTQSFRFGEAIASAANAVLANYLHSPLRLRGFDKLASTVGPIAEPRCFIARTNATLVGEVFRTMTEAPREIIAVVGGVSDLIRLVEGAVDLRQGRRTTCPDLFGIDTFEELVEISQTEGGEEFARLVDLVTTYPSTELLASLHRIAGNEKNEDYATRILTTAHRSKGREWDTVRLADDFATPVIKQEPGGPREVLIDTEEANLLYVAMTRARLRLDYSACGGAVMAQQLGSAAPALVTASAVDNVTPLPVASSPAEMQRVRPQHREAPLAAADIEAAVAAPLRALPSHWALDTRQFSPDVRARLEAMCHYERIDLTQAIGRWLEESLLPAEKRAG